MRSIYSRPEPAQGYPIPLAANGLNDTRRPRMAKNKDKKKDKSDKSDKKDKKDKSKKK